MAMRFDDDDETRRDADRIVDPDHYFRLRFNCRLFVRNVDESGSCADRHHHR